MKIKSLTISNFLVIGKAEINLDNRGLLLVQGENDDDSSADSNGAGKSSIVDAISWCLYGETARGVSGDAVVNNTAGKDCSASVVIEDEGEEYTIARYRKHHDHKNDLTVVRNGVADLTKGTTKLTQDVINKIVGCSYEVFIAAVYSGQEKMPDLPGMTDKQLKLIVEEAAGIERLQAASDIAVLKNRSAQSAVDKKLSEQASVITLIADKEGESRGFDAKGIDFATEKVLEVEKHLLDIAELFSEKNSIPITTPSIRVANADELVEIAKRIEDSQNGEKEGLKVLDVRVKVCEKRSSEWGIEVRLATQAAKQGKSELEKVEERVGTPCSECGKEYHGDDIADARTNATKKLREQLLNLKSYKAHKEQADNELNIALTAQKTFTDAMIDVSALLKRQSDLKHMADDISKRDKQASDIQAKIDALQSLIEQINKQIDDNPYLKMKEAKNAEIAGLVAKKESITDDLLKLEDELAVTAAAVDVFGRAGVRAHILDTVTPFLNDRTAEYLGTLTDGNIVASWSTIGKTAKGELREKFGIEVSKKNGSGTFSGLSGGEKRKVRLSSSMALQDLVASRVSKPIEFLMADEIDDALDTSGLERLMTILEKRGKEKGTLLVISHNDLGVWISNSITVRNSGGVSEVIDV